MLSTEDSVCRVLETECWSYCFWSADNFSHHYIQSIQCQAGSSAFGRAIVSYVNLSLWWTEGWPWEVEEADAWSKYLNLKKKVIGEWTIWLESVLNIWLDFWTQPGFFLREWQTISVPWFISEVFRCIFYNETLFFVMAASVISICRVFGDGLIHRLVNSVRGEYYILGCPFKTMCSCHGKL